MTFHNQDDSVSSSPASLTVRVEMNSSAFWNRLKSWNKVENACLLLVSNHVWHIHNFDSLIIVCTPPSPISAGGLNLQPNFQKEGSLAGPQLLDGGCWERGGWLFSGGLQFSQKNKLKAEIFNGKKQFISKNNFLCHN